MDAVRSGPAVLGGVRFQRLQPSTHWRYKPCNPALLQTSEGYLVVCRTVSFSSRRRRSAPGDAVEVIRTRNVLMRLASDFTVIEERAMTIDEPPLRREPIQGLEDCRLFEIDRTRYVTCTTADRHPSGHLHMSICRIEDDGRIAAHRPLVGPFDGRTQKNWLPFATRGGKLRAIYQYDPLTVVRICVQSGRYELDIEVPHRWNASGWRGSAGPIRIPGSRRMLILVHEIVPVEAADPRRQRIYVHRFIECDARFALTRVSPPFVFAHYGIEFPCGMALTHEGHELVIGLGMGDDSAYLCRMSLATVENLLQVDSPSEAFEDVGSWTSSERRPPRVPPELPVQDPVYVRATEEITVD